MNLSAFESEKKNITTGIEYLKGTVDFDSSPGRGTLIAFHP